MASSVSARSAFVVAAFVAVPCVLRPQDRKTPPPAPKSSLAPIQRHQHPNAPHATGEHLAEWMNTHRSLSPDQQQQALEREPGFSSLPQATQQRMRDRLKQLNEMTPQQRQQILARNEAVEHMTPEQRGEFRSAMQQLAALPPEQRRYVARTFRGLRELSPEQRQHVLDSERFNTLTDAQRSTLNSLMKVEPLMPPPYDAAANAPPPPTASHP